MSQTFFIFICILFALRETFLTPSTFAEIHKREKSNNYEKHGSIRIHNSLNLEKKKTRKASIGFT